MKAGDRVRDARFGEVGTVRQLLFTERGGVHGAVVGFEKPGAGRWKAVLYDEIVNDMEDKQ